MDTMRPVAPSLELILGETTPVLDHGFVRVVDYMGVDESITQAARVSYIRGTRVKNDDRNLIRYLMRHWHTTPFEMCEIKLHVKMPIFVARQWVRHRTASINEMSARYSILDGEFYTPTLDQMQAQSKTNKQGREHVLSHAQAEHFRNYLIQDAAVAYDHYEEMVGADIHEGDGNDNLARELARMNLPTSVYTQWYWKTNLHNLFHFLRLRADDHAQYEIRVYAKFICELVKRWVPIAYEAFEDYRLNAISLSGPALEVVRQLLRNEDVNVPDTGLSDREWHDLMRVLEIVKA